MAGNCSHCRREITSTTSWSPWSFDGHETKTDASGNITSQYRIEKRTLWLNFDCSNCGWRSSSAIGKQEELKLYK